MIHVQGEILDSSVFFGGATVTCLLCISNKRSNIQREDGLAWGSAQVVGLASTLNHQGKDEEPSTHIQKATSLSSNKGERGQIVYSTKPKILFCDVKIQQDQELHFPFEFILPQDLPPSFSGANVRYSYKVKLAVQRVGESIKFMQLPFRVQSVQDIPLAYPDRDSPLLNPFISRPPKQDYNESTLEMLMNMTSRRSPVIYNITNQRGKVARLCLFKSMFRLGEDIIGTFDFTDATVPCYQYLVTLQSEETRASEESDTNSDPEKIVPQKAVRHLVSHAKCHEICAGFEHTNFALPVPLHGTQSFETSLVNHSWKLHFEFVTCTSDISLKSTGKNFAGPPQEVEVETMVWDFPVKVFPTAPAHIDKALFVKRSQVLTL